MKTPVITVLTAQKPGDITADTFLQTVFDQCEGAVVVCNSEDGFRSHRWHPGKELSGTVYFGISTVRDPNPRAAILQRRTTDLVKTYDIVLDDIGTKVDRKLLEGKLAPSCRIETSPGNEQWHYFIKEGCDPARAAALIEALAQAGLTDPGAKRADRIMRPPGSINTKYGEPFAARVLEWAPDRHIYGDVCRGLGVTPTDTPVLGSGPVELPPGMSDPLFDWLREHGLVREGPNPRGWYSVTCSQEHLHSGEVDHGTDYLPGMPGVFKCMHGHCVDVLNVNTLREWAQAQDPGADLSLMSGETLKAIGAKLLEATEAVQMPDGTFIAGEAKLAAEATAEAILADLVHIKRENMWWSYEANGLTETASVEICWTARMLEAGLLGTTTATGKPSKVLLTLTNWLKRNKHTQKANELIHRLGMPRIVEGNLNIAPDLPKRALSNQEPGPWLDLVSFVCSDVERDTELVLDWLAMLATALTEKPGWHLLFKGGHGTGKNMILGPIKRYLGDKLAITVGESELASGFTTFLSRRLIQADELTYNTKGATTPRDIYQKIKGWTARGTGLVFVNDKNTKIYSALDLGCWVITSNNSVPLPLERGDRRFLVAETPTDPWPDEDYAAVAGWLEYEGGDAAVVAWLHRRWDAMPEARRAVLRGRAPMTEAKRALIVGSSEGIEGAVRLAIEGEDGVCWPNLMTAEDVMAELKNTITFHFITDSVRKQINLQRIGLALRAAGAVKLFGSKPVRDKDRKQYNMWCLRPDMVSLYRALGQGQALMERYRKERTLSTPFSLVADRNADD
jgi:hypothetical protein